MGWERGRYYYRSRKIDGRVVREYAGMGERGEAAAAEDARRRTEREEAREDERCRRQEAREFDAAIDRLVRDVWGLMEVVMAELGYHRRKRGFWQRERRRTARDSGGRARPPRS